MRKRILITGVKGMLGTAILPLFTRYDVVGIDKDTHDITDKIELGKTLPNRHFDVVIHCAAYTNVDGAESKPEEAFLVNAQGVKNLIEVLGNKDCFFIYISTDYVFDGTKDSEYTENDCPNPLGVYGASKLEGERIVSGLQQHLIIRTSWLFGPNGKNFVSTIADLAKQKESLEVVKDQRGSPTYTLDLAKAISDIIELYFTQQIKSGIYNITNTGFCSWFELAEYIVKKTCSKAKIMPVTSTQFKREAKRPRNSMLSKEKFKTLCGYYLPDWQDAVSRYLESIQLAKGEVLS